MWRLKSKPSTESGPPNPSLALDRSCLVLPSMSVTKAKHHLHGVILDSLGGK